MQEKIKEGEVVGRKAASRNFSRAMVHEHTFPTPRLGIWFRRHAFTHPCNVIIIAGEQYHVFGGDFLSLDHCDHIIISLTNYWLDYLKGISILVTHAP